MGFKKWLSPAVMLASNPISLLGVVLTTTGGVMWMFLLPSMVSGRASHPYLGIAMFMVLPMVFFAGLGLIPIGIWLKRRSDRKRGIEIKETAVIDFSSPQFKRVLAFFLATTVVNVIIGAQFSYRAVHYMESVAFCGLTCHTVMEPEYTAYQNSPHSRVDCVACHIGPGAGWFVKSKLDGTWQVISVSLNLYPRPIPTPISNLRPARETCEQCHWPQKFGTDRIRVISKYADDETNTLSKSVLMMRIGGGKTIKGIHGTHLGEGVQIHYASSDKSRETIPWVEYNDGKGGVRQYLGADAKPGVEKGLEIRLMDCMDCHTRPSHNFDLPERAVDHAMTAGEISPALPFVKKTSVELLKHEYASHEAGENAIRAGIEKFYREKYADVYQQKRAVVESAGRAVAAIYKRNVFPKMSVKWGTYKNQIGHTDAPGCFRCHDDGHIASGEKKITQDCNACHQMLAMDEANPKVLAELGIE